MESTGIFSTLYSSDLSARTITSILLRPYAVKRGEETAEEGCYLLDD
jgi:hypothetical protein